MILVAAAGNAALVSFCVYTLGVFVLAWLASRTREGKSRGWFTENHPRPTRYPRATRNYPFKKPQQEDW